MVKQVPYFEDSSGKPHKTQYEAWRAELILWLSATKALSNEAQAKAIVDHITAGGSKRAGELHKIIGELMDCMPACDPIAPMPVVSQ